MFGSLKMALEISKCVKSGLLYGMGLKQMSGRGIKGVANKAIEMGVGLLVVALILPIALTQFFGVNTDTWDAQTVAIWVVLPVIGILALGLHFFNQLKSGRR